MVRSWVETRRRTFGEKPQAAPDPVAVVAATPSASAPPRSEEPESRAVDPLNAAVVKNVGGPLMSAVSQVAASLREQGVPVSALEEARVFGQLVQQVVNIVRTTAATLEIKREDVTASGEPLRRLLLEVVGDLVAAYYRAAGQLQPGGVVGQMVAAITQIAIEGARREDFMPGLGTTTQARLGLDMLRAVPPIVHAVVRFAFGRSPLVLMTEVAWEMQYKAVDVTKKLLGTGATLEAWHAFYGAALHAVAEIYAEAHYAEADRLARLMGGRGSRGELPMADVWLAFDRQTDLLSRFSGHMMAVAEAVSAREHF